MSGEPIIEPDYPEWLYVKERTIYSYMYPYDVEMVGKKTLEEQVSDNGREQRVAVYKLVEVQKFKKVVTKTVTLERINS